MQQSLPDAPVAPRHVGDSRVWRVLELLDESPQYSVDELASRVNLSPSRLSTLFKTVTGAKLGQYLARQRARTAAHLLVATDEPIKRIASAVGYNHSSSFIRAFNHHFSESPKAYRHRMRRMSPGVHGWPVKDSSARHAPAANGRSELHPDLPAF